MVELGRDRSSSFHELSLRKCMRSAETGSKYLMRMDGQMDRGAVKSLVALGTLTT